MMEGKIDWTALEIVCDLLGVNDVHELVDDLITVRTHVYKKDK